MKRLTCGCGWAVLAGLDCDFCSMPADELLAIAAGISEVIELPELRPV